MVKQPQDFKAKLAKASLPERSVDLCLNGALRADYDQLQTELVQMTADGSGRLGGNPQARAVAEQMQALRDEMADSEVTVTLRALPNARWMQLVTDHAPRKDNTGDATVGYNQATFYPALIRESFVDPVLDDDEFTQLLDALNSHQFDELANAAWALNRGDVRVPFSALASETLRNSGETSQQQSGSASAPDDSGVGNRPARRRTATAAPSPVG